MSLVKSMSFTGNIKNEITNIEYSDSEYMAELSAILNIGAKIYDDRFELYTESASVARRIYKLIKDIYHVEIEMDSSGINSLRGNKLIQLTVVDKVEFILDDLCIYKDGERTYIPDDFRLSENTSCRGKLAGEDRITHV